MRKQELIEDVVLTHGFWHDRRVSAQSEMRDSIRSALDNPENSAGFVNFRIAAGVEQGTHLGTHWSDGDCYKYLEGLSYLYGYCGEDEILDELRENITQVKEAQEEDGYINTQIQIPGKARWITRLHHEDYNLGHLFAAAAVNYTATGDTDLLGIAKRAADNLYERFNSRWRDAGQFGWNPTHIPGLVDLFRVTGDGKYLSLAKLFLYTRGAEDPIYSDQNPVNKISDLNQMGVPFREEKYAVGHAVTAAYLYQGAAEVASETGDQQLMATAKTIWNDIVKRKMYITGGVGAHHFWVSSRGHEVHEAFGRQYQLPHYLAYNETCANIAFAMFGRSMTEITGEAGYADTAETVLFNAGLSGTSLDGVKFRYANPLRWHAALGEAGDDHHLSHASHDRWATRSCYCCPPQQFRLLASIQSWLYAKTADGVEINHYAASTVHAEIAGHGVAELEIETDYPWDGKVTIKIVKSVTSEWTLGLRVPGWADGATATRNGSEQREVEPGTYLRMSRRWQPGDTVGLDLPMDIRLVKAHPLVEETRNQVAVMRGPVVYCLEGADVDGGSSVHRILIPSTFTADEEMIVDFAGRGRVLVLNGTAYEEESSSEDQLYTRYEGPRVKETTVRLIPYYAWNNRGKNDMTVWIPLATS